MAGCAGEDAPDAREPVPQEEYLGGGVFELDDDTGGAGARVTVGQNVSALRIEIVYDAIASIEPRLFGIPGCEWRMHTTVTRSETDSIGCAEVVPGEHEVRVEHDGGPLRIAVRVLGRVPASAPAGP